MKSTTVTLCTLAAVLSCAAPHQAGGAGRSEANTAPPASATARPGVASIAGSGGPALPGECVPSGKGKDYQVGPGPGQLAALNLVPWERLRAGDTVRIFWRPTPYLGKFLVSAKGTADKPVRVCGVKGPEGERPVIDGKNAVSRPGLDYGHPLHESRTIVLIHRLGAQDYRYFPEHIIIEGLELTGQYPSYSFTDAAGKAQRYADFGACIWIERGHHLTIRDNVIHDCANGIFSKSLDEGEFTITKDLLIQGNHIYDCGLVNDYHAHDSYLQSLGVTYELNHYGPQRKGGLGSALKDRSVGAVIRYNHLDGCARSLDLVEAEDWSSTALKDPRYRTTLVYGNLITTSTDAGGIPIHYGGDHAGGLAGQGWGEPIYRKGVLFFFNNTMVVSGDTLIHHLFQLSTTDEHAEIFNNVFYHSGKVTFMGLRTGQEVGKGYTAGGTINLGVNWMNRGWVENDEYHPVPGPVSGKGKMLVGAEPPIALGTFRPLPGSAAIDAAQAFPPPALPVLLEYTHDRKGRLRTIRGSSIDLGAFEAN